MEEGGKTRGMFSVPSVIPDSLKISFLLHGMKAVVLPCNMVISFYFYMQISFKLELEKQKIQEEQENAPEFVKVKGNLRRTVQETTEAPDS